jgi:polyisoprenoid-binding protein YceI
MGHGFGWTAVAATVALVVAGAATTARAQERVLELDPAHTQINFTLDATFHTVHGTFQLKRGSVRFNSDSGVASGVVVIDARSGKTGNDSRDTRMNAEILQSDKYPEIIFVPDSVTGRIDLRDPFQVNVHGTIKMHGAEHPITITTQLDPKGNQLSSTSRFAIPYLEWGVKNPSTMLLRVGDKIFVEMHTEGKYAPVGSMASRAGNDWRPGAAQTAQPETMLGKLCRIVEQLEWPFAEGLERGGAATCFTSAQPVDSCLKIHYEAITNTYSEPNSL